MTNIAIVFHSGYGHTEVLAHEVATGITEAGGTPHVHKIEGLNADFGPMLEALAGADAIIFGSPTYMGTVSAPFKAFMDASSKPWFTQDWKDKLAAGFTNSGSLSGDKLNTLTTLSVFAAQHSMIWVSLGVMSHNMSGNTDTGADQINRLGGGLGLLAQSDNAGPDVTPPSGDRASARALGERVTVAAKRWRTAV